MILQGNCLDVLPTLEAGSIHTCVTSPPYWGLRDYGTAEQLGLEKTPEEYVQNMVKVFREVKRVLRDDGTLWLNLGDSYANNRGNTADNPGFDNKAAGYGASLAIGHKRIVDGLKNKDLVGIPWMVAFALRADGWYLRSDIIWNKPNPMPESVTDRPTKSHEYIFLLSKSEKYYYDHEAIKENSKTEPQARDKNAEGYNADYAKGNRFSEGVRVFGADGMKNKRTVWTVATKPYSEAHFATYPPELIEPCILAGCPTGGTVLDPFNGAATTGLVAMQNNREYIGIELNSDYIGISEKRLSHIQPKLIF